MSKNFFTIVADCVAKRSMSEAYILIDDNVMTAPMGDDRMMGLLASLGDDKLSPKDRIARDYNMMAGPVDVMFTEKAKGFITIDGVLVSYAFAKISDKHLRAHFVRVDVSSLYTDTQERLSKLEKDVSALMRVAKLEGLMSKEGCGLADDLLARPWTSSISNAAPSTSTTGLA